MWRRPAQRASRPSDSSRRRRRWRISSTACARGLTRSERLPNISAVPFVPGAGPATDVGGRLRRARERCGVTLRQIASATKISVGVLEALERNDISRLPGGIFSRAFVRSYAIEVGLDPEATIQDFIAAFPHDSVTADRKSTRLLLEQQHP